MRQAQQNDEDIAPVLTAKVEGRSKPHGDDLHGMTAPARLIVKEWERLHVIHELLYIGWKSADCTQSLKRLVMPFCYRDLVMEHIHDSKCMGHFESRRTQLMVATRYFLFKMRSDIERYIRTCDTCQRRKRPGITPHAPMSTFKVGEPFERVAMDICGKLPRTASGNQYVLVIADYFSKYTSPVAVQDKTKEAVAEAFIANWVTFFGMPEILHTDRCGEFENRLLHEICERCYVTKTRTTSFHPRSNGLVERFNLTMSHVVNSHCDEYAEWDVYLPFVRK